MKDNQELLEARQAYWNTRVVTDDDGRRSVYYTTVNRSGYNRHDYTAFRMFGPPLGKDRVGAAFGAIGPCGGASFDKDPAECDFGEKFSFVVWGCD